MEKINLEFSNVSGHEKSKGTEHLIDALASLSTDEIKNLVSLVDTMISNGDIWFIHDAVTEDNFGVKVSMILDSKGTATEFEETIKPFFDKCNLTKFTTETLSFEEFATFAAENEESNFNPLQEFGLTDENLE